jgi:hypothetical protein
LCVGPAACKYFFPIDFSAALVFFGARAQVCPAVQFIARRAKASSQRFLFRFGTWLRSLCRVDLSVLPRADLVFLSPRPRVFFPLRCGSAGVFFVSRSLVLAEAPGAVLFLVKFLLPNILPSKFFGACAPPGIRCLRRVSSPVFLVACSFSAVPPGPVPRRSPFLFLVFFGCSRAGVDTCRFPQLDLLGFRRVLSALFGGESQTTIRAFSGCHVTAGGFVFSSECCSVEFLSVGGCFVAGESQYFS